MKKTIQSLAIAAFYLLNPILSGAQEFNSATAKSLGADEKNVLFPSRDMLEIGRAVAETACAECHGMNGISDLEGKPHLAGQRTVYIYRVLQAFENGTRSDENRQHNKFLNDQAQLSASVYYANLMPAQPAEVSEDDVVEQAVAVEEDPFEALRPAMKKCLKCHNESGNSDSKGMPSLTAQHPEYFVTSMLGYINGARSHKLMKKLVGRLEESDIKAMGVYYAVQQPIKTAIEGEGDPNVGARLAEDCESCHGDRGNSKKNKMPSLAGQDAKYFIKAMMHYQDGTRQHEKMFEAVENLSEQDVIDLATYYAAQEPRKRDIRTPLKSTEWIARCERCHGIDGNSNDPRFPMLAGQDATYLQTALRAYASGERENSIMHAMAAPLSSRDIERIGSYFAAQQPKSVIYIQLPDRQDEIK